jgi:molecular chaperone DnaK (HSP70)
MIVGIDLGTTNSLVGIIQQGRPHLFKDTNSSPLIPSVVTIENSKILVGYQAKNNVQRNTVYSSKRFIGKGLNEVKHHIKNCPFDFSESDEKIVRFKIENKAYTPIEIASFVLNKLKNLAESELNQKVEKAVVTVPAYFNDVQRQATKLAGELSGLEIVRILNEPTAACLAYGLDKKTKGNIAVFDLGGGTFDISILRVENGIFEVLATNGDTELGGDDFDLAIAKSINPQFEFLNPDKKNELLKVAEQLKKEERFEKAIIQPILNRVLKPIENCLKDSGLSIDQITDVILVGGSTRMPLVQQKVKEIFKREPVCSLNPDEVVAMGAAIQANILMGQTKDMLLLDVIPLSLGIETMGGVITKLIHRNSRLPISATENFSTYVDGQVTIDLHVLQGERELAKDNRSLARFQLKGIPPMPAGIPQLEVEFIVDANGILNVKAIEKRTSTTASITVNPTSGLTDTVVEKMLMESYENAETDFNKRFLIEAQNDAEAILRATTKSLEKGAHLLDAEEKEKIEKSLSALKISLNQNNLKEIKENIEKLNEETKEFAEKLLNQAVSDVLKDKTIGAEK